MSRFDEFLNDFKMCSEEFRRNDILVHIGLEFDLLLEMNDAKHAIWKCMLGVFFFVRSSQDLLMVRNPPLMVCVATFVFVPAAASDVGVYCSIII